MLLMILVKMVDRRIGGLEIIFREQQKQVSVDRRIGGLEKYLLTTAKAIQVDRRIGGLEIMHW